MAVIACKLPSGLTVEHAGKSVTLNGANHDRAVAGFGMTHDVDADWFKAWADENPAFPPLKSGAIFIATTPAKAEGAAEERTDDASVQTGMEPIDPNKPGNGVEPTEEQKRENEKIAATATAPAAK